MVQWLGLCALQAVQCGQKKKKKVILLGRGNNTQVTPDIFCSLELWFSVRFWFSLVLAMRPQIVCLLSTYFLLFLSTCLSHSQSLL